MTSFALTLRQVAYEQRSFWRNRQAAFFTFLLPILFLLIFGSLNRDGVHRGIAYDAYLVPGLLAYGVTMATFAGLALGLVRARESGELKRMRGTPLPPWAFLGGRVGSSVLVTVLLATAMLALGTVWGVHVRAATVPGLLLALVLGTVCFSTLGIAMLRLIPNADAAPVIMNVLVLPLTFFSGVWGPSDGIGGWLARIAAFFPIEHLASALRTAFDPRVGGPGIAGGDLKALLVWSLVGSVLMVKALRAEIHRD